MKTITLKLTPNNNRNMEECLKGSKWSTLCAILHQANLKPKDVGIEVLDSTSVGGGFTCDVLDVDKFREFLNDEIKAIPRPLNEPSRVNYNNLKSILSKLDKAVVQNDDDGVADGLELDSETNYLNNIDEPKCTKCGSKFEDEIWKTDGLEYEQYRCSNEDCQAIHTINIDRNDEEGGEVDIDRHWDTLEFVEFYNVVQNDKPKRYTELFTYVHFVRQNTYDVETQIKEFISEELKHNSEAQVTEDESGDSRLLKYNIESDNIDWYFSDDKGNKVTKEDSLIVGGLKDNTYRVYFSRVIISDYQGDEYYLEDWTTKNEYYKDNVCDHNNTITNNCSDCDEQELIDAHHQRVLRESLRDIYNICCDSLGDIISNHCEGYEDFIYKVEENVKKEIYNRLNYEYTCTKKETK